MIIPPDNNRRNRITAKCGHGCYKTALPKLTVVAAALLLFPYMKEASSTGDASYFGSVIAEVFVCIAFFKNFSIFLFKSINAIPD